MNVIVEIPDDRALRFQQEAQARGLSVDRWLLELAEQSVSAESIAHLQKTDPEEWMRQLRAWSRSHDRTIPALTLESLSRESLYADRV